MGSRLWGNAAVDLRAKHGGDPRAAEVSHFCGSAMAQCLTKNVIKKS
jgi:hypothetical protein